MKTVIICEKPSQAQNLKKALGSSYGEILPMAGHLIGFKMPEEIDPALEKWGYDLIIPEGKKSLGKSKFLNPIKEALKQADNVIVATDCDREGTLLGREVLDFFGYRGSAQRAIFTAEDEKSLREAFKKLKPLSSTNNEYEAAKGRETADYILGLTMTRSITKSLGQFVAVGRVKSPTFGIVTKRELEIRNFKPQNYYNLELEIDGLKLNYVADPMVLNKNDYANLLSNKPKTCYLKKEVKKGKQSPPKPFDLLALTKNLSDVPAKKVLELAQSLYETHKIATYPRSESRHLPLNMLPSSKELFSTITALYSLETSEPIIRKGKTGVFFDSDASHHAIIPNINSDIKAIYPNLSELEKRAFDAIAKQFIASLSPDAEYEQTTYTTKVDGYLFKKSGKVFTDLGYLKILGKSEKENKEALTDIKEGEYKIIDILITTHVTKPPSRFTEASLADAMKNAWRFVEDPKYQELLKGTSGIGTQATRADIIEALKDPKQDIFKIDKKHIVPTDKALKFYEIINRILPELIDPAVTAMWELSLSMIEEGKITHDQFINRVKERTQEYVEVAQNNEIKIERKPSQKQINLAKELAKMHSLSLPDLNNYDATKNFIDVVFKDVESGKLEKKERVFKPSKKQLDFAKKISKSKNKPIPKKALQNAKLLSEFINENK